MHTSGTTLLEYAYCTLASMHTPDNNYELVLEYAYYAY